MQITSRIPEVTSAISYGVNALTQKTKSAGINGLTDDEKAMIKKLKKRDAEVKAHEQAHKSAGGSYAGAVSYDYQRGPDGKNYAVGGTTSIDSSKIAGDPEATIRKMEIVIKAALAPMKPSSQDYKVASQARQSMTEARSELRKLNQEEAKKAYTDETIQSSSISFVA